jgi:sulfatase modifying factor 1
VNETVARVSRAPRSPALAELTQAKFLKGTLMCKMGVLIGMLAAAMTLLSLRLRASPISLHTVTVGNPNNAADSADGYGAVGYSYKIGTCDVTLDQYTAFLNAVAKTDTYGLYNTSLATNLNVAGISRAGSPGAYSYAVIGDGQRPVTYVTWYDAVRFTNWLTDGNTEIGAYTITNGGNNSGTITVPSPAQRATWSHSTSAFWYLPDENEWYKAAYYDPSLGGANKYWFYPTKSNNPPSADPPPGGTNSANYFGPNGYVLTQSMTSSPTQNYLTGVGAYINSPSAYGTLDQGGDVFQWNDLDASTSSSVRGYRGGDFAGDSFFLDSTVRFTVTPVFSNYTTGFRVAPNLGVPEPGGASMLLICGVAIGVWRLRRNSKH